MLHNGPFPVSDIERFLHYIEPVESGCWLWRGWVKPNGYGAMSRSARDGRGKNIYAHRFAYEWFIGPIPAGLSVDHLCRVRNCVNPDHLEPVTTAVNLARGAHPMFVAHANGTCLRGHPLSVTPAGATTCHPCRAAYARERRAQLRYDAAQHGRNAAATRRRKREAAPA